MPIATLERIVVYCLQEPMSLRVNILGRARLAQAVTGSSCSDNKLCQQGGSLRDSDSNLLSDSALA